MASATECPVAWRTEFELWAKKGNNWSKNETGTSNPLSSQAAAANCRFLSSTSWHAIQRLAGNSNSVRSSGYIEELLR